LELSQIADFFKDEKEYELIAENLIWELQTIRDQFELTYLDEVKESESNFSPEEV
jgi:hypothetical protein